MSNKKSEFRRGPSELTSQKPLHPGSKTPGGAGTHTGHTGAYMYRCLGVFLPEYSGTGTTIGFLKRCQQRIPRNVRLLARGKKKVGSVVDHARDRELACGALKPYIIHRMDRERVQLVARAVQPTALQYFPCHRRVGPWPSTKKSARKPNSFYRYCSRPRFRPSR